ncbi:MAG TPA: Globin-like protein [Oceanospirillaceae bacterium]|nr:Globin-like protein [Oceanospirillaceae bacterium]
MQGGKQKLYDLVGGTEVIRELVENFYDIVESDPDGELVHQLHLRGMGINHLRNAQFEYLCGFLGGPQLYVERYGHANNRKIHEHVEIGVPEVESWLKCMEKAIDKVGLSAEIRQRLMVVFRHSAASLKDI